MHYKWDKKYLYGGITAFLVIAFGILFYYLLFHGVKVQAGLHRVVTTLMPVTFGFVIAYILTPIVNALEQKMIYPLMLRKKKSISVKAKKRIRFVSVFLTLVIAVLAVYGLFAMLIPQIVKSVQSIVFQSSSYLKNISQWINSISTKYPEIQTFLDTNNISFNYESVVEWIQNNVDIDKYVQNFSGAFSTLYNGVSGALKVAMNFAIGVIISIYLMLSKEKFAGQAKKIVYAVAERRTANRFIKNMRFVHRTFIGFLSGKIIDSIIIGILCFIGTSLIGTPYSVLVSVIVGVTNVIPFFGPYLGAVPSALLILIVDPIQCLYFILFIIFLQQLDGNVIGPKILGDSTGLSSFWVIFAITIFGGMFGIFGMFIGVPLFAVIFAAFRTLFNRMLKKKGLPIATDNYLRVREIGNDQEFINQEDQELDPSDLQKKKEEKRQNSKLYKVFSAFRKKGSDSNDDKMKDKSIDNHSKKESDEEKEK